MSEETIPYFKPDKKSLSDKELIEELKIELKRVRIQRNEYERQLIVTNRELQQKVIECVLLDRYINRTKK